MNSSIPKNVLCESLEDATMFSLSFLRLFFLLVLIDWKGFFNAQLVHFFLINPVWKFDGIFSPPR